VHEIAVKDFGGQAHSAILAKVAVLLAKRFIVSVFAEDSACHFQRVEEVRAIGEEITILGASHIALRGVRRAIVKPHIMRDCVRDAVFFHRLIYGVFCGFQPCERALACVDVGDIAVHLVGVVCRGHQRVVEKGFGYDERLSLIDRSVLVYDGKAEVIDDWIVKGVRGFGVKDKIIQGEPLFLQGCGGVGFSRPLAYLLYHRPLKKSRGFAKKSFVRIHKNAPPVLGILRAPGLHE